MVAWLGPAVVAWPFWARYLAYATAWTAWAMFLHWYLPVYQDACRWAGILSKQKEREPTLSTFEIVGVNCANWFVSLTPASLVLAWYNPTPESWTYASAWNDVWVHLIPLVVYHAFAIGVWDTSFYFWHRWAHKNKWAYRTFHKKHHNPEAIISVHASSYNDPIDVLVTGGLFSGLLAYIGCAYLHSYWYYALAVNVIIFVSAYGHCGAYLETNELALWGHSIVSGPAAMSMTFIGNPADPSYHAGHHFSPLFNFALASTYWDDKFGTSKPARLPHPFPLMALGLLFGVLALWVLQCLTRVWPLALLLIPARVQNTLLQPLSSWMPRVGLWDSIRSLYQVTYAPKGTPGAFEADPKQHYIFCYHPQNIIARGAWYTFAGVGKESPAAPLPRCRVAVGRWVMNVPLGSQLMRAFGACGSSWGELEQLLRSKVPTSVALTPDGFSQGKYMGTYSLVLKKRKGFVRLAHTTGALLVPVLGLGEHMTIPGTWYPAVGTMGNAFPKAVTGTRMNPIKVVFGQPLAVLPGESVEATHARYTAALLKLGKEHGVALDIAE